MRAKDTLLAALCLLCGAASSGVWAAASPGPIFNIAHFDVMPMATGDVDFLQQGYALLFKYRDQSKADPGLLSFRILDLLAPTTNHSEIVQVWDNLQDYQQHLSQSHTTAFRFDVQGSARLGGICCIGSPIDDRQYILMGTFGTAWTSPEVPAMVGPSGAVFIISYVEFLPGGNPAQEQGELLAYGLTTLRSNPARLVNFSVLQELNRSNRYALLEIWNDRQGYQVWQGSEASQAFLARLRSRLGSPIDHRLTSLCGQTFVDNKGCAAP